MNLPQPQPPRVPEWLLRRSLPRGVVGKSILGDAREEFHRNLRRIGPLRAKGRYWKNALSVALRFAGPGAPRRNPDHPSKKVRADIMSDFWFDIRNAGRLLLRRPGLTLIAVVSLGLGIGANTAIFSLVNTILLKPLPYPKSEELVEAFRIDEGVTGFDPTIARVSGLWAVPYEVHLDWLEMSPVFAAGGGYAGTRVTFQGSDGPASLLAALSTSGVFAALEVAPALGRPFLPEDDAVGAPAVAVLSHGLWQGQFGEDPDILGRQLELDGSAFTVVGVMPRGFAFPSSEYQLWISFPDELKTSPVRNAGYLKVLARLTPGITLDQARREMAQVAARIGEAHPEEAEHGVGLFLQKDMLVADSGPRLLLCFGAVALVLLIACINLAGLFLVRATERGREIGVRRALGAGSRRLVTQQMSESLLISFMGGVAGGALAVFGMEPFLALMPSDLPRLWEVSVDTGLLVIALGFSLLTGILTGLLPALRAAGTPITTVLQEGGRSLAGGRSRNRTQAGLVVSQIALAFVLLAGAGLFIRSMTSLTSVDPGFETEHTIVTAVGTPPALLPSRAEGGPWGDVLAYYRDLEDRLRALPGVQEVGAANQMPFFGGWSAPPATTETSEGLWEGTLHVASVTPSYLSTMEVPLLVGRALSPDDGPGSEPVAVVSQALADRMAPGGSPLGLRIRIDTQGDSIWRTVVGVTGDVRYRLSQGPMAMAFVPMAQRPTELGLWVVRTAPDPSGSVPGIQNVFREMNPEGSPYIRLLDELVRESYAVVSARFSVILLGSLAGLAAFMAILGVYGVLAYLVQLRTREIGIQLAMGADRRRVLRTFLSRGVGMAGIGIGIGGLLFLGLARVAESQLFGVQPLDPATLLSAGILLFGASLAASYLPARQAGGLDPVEVLRRE
ncbi:MAG: ADOP family duplicated permease [Longimicrobiales bacterium]